MASLAIVEDFDRRSPAISRKPSRGSNRRSGSGRRRIQHRLAQAARRHPIRQARAARRHEDQDRRLVDRCRACWRSSRRRATSCRARSSTGASCQAEVDLHRSLPSYINPKTGRVHTSYALAATTTGRLASSDPNLQNIPIRTEEGRAHPHRLHRRQGQEADPRRLQPDRAAPARPHRRHPAAAAGLRRRPGHPRDDRVARCSACRSRACRGRAAARQGDQFRHRLRHLGLRPRQPARHLARARRAPTSRPISSVSPASATTWRRCKAEVRASRATSDAVRPQGALSRDQLQEPVRARVRRARRHQRADPGRGRRHHPPRHDPHGAGAARRRGSRRACCCRCTTNWCSRRRRARSRATMEVASHVMERSPSRC